MPPPSLNKAVYFASFLVTPSVFYTTPLSFAIVNLKPLLPGHVLVSPHRCVPRISDLSAEEITDLFMTVQRVGRMVERVFGASALNIGIQDGEAAGQSVPHVHAHIIPRKSHDLDHRGGNDAIYGMLEGEEGDFGKHQAEHAKREQQAVTGSRRGGPWPEVDEEARKPRTTEEMRKEAEWLASEMEKEKDCSPS